MALSIQLNIGISKDCNTLYVSDVTRSYDVDTNPGGYDTSGAINLDPNDIDTNTGYVTFQKTDGTEYTFTLSPTDFDVANIDTSGLISKAITMDDLEELGMDTEDDVWKITYGFTASSVEYSASCYTVKDCTACCVIKSLLADIDFCTNCNKTSISKKNNEVIMAKIALEMASARATCSDVTGAKELLDYVNSLGEITRCDSCN